MIRRLVLSLALLTWAGCSGGGSTPVGVNTVNGTVTITGATSQAGITVALLGPTSAVTTTDSTGAYSFQAVLKGNYEVTAQAPSTSPQYVTATVTTTGLAGSPPPVVVAPLTLTGLGTITGTATLNGATTGNSGILVAAVGGEAVSTNDSGAFTLKNIPVGSTTVVATFAGYLPATSASVTVAYDQSVGLPAPLTLQSGQAAGTGVISGSVTNGEEGAAAAGLQGVTVWLSGPTTGAMAQTDMDGGYTFSDLTPGTYTITAVAPSTVQSIESTSVVLSSSATSPVMASAIAFSTLGSVTGLATFGTTTGNGGIVVAASGGTTVAVTNDAGKFTLMGVPTGSATIIASAAGFAPATGMLSVAWNKSNALGQTLVLTPATAQGSIAGTVTVNGMLGAQTVMGIPVTAVGGPSSYFGLTDDSSGDYSITDVPNGPYAVSVSVPDTIEGTQSQSVDIADGGMASASFTFTGTGTITGIATLGGAMTGNAGITIQVQGASASATTGPSGDFTLTGVPTGSQTVLATYPGYAQASQSGIAVTWQVNNTTLTTSPLTLTAGTGGSGTITGTIKFGNDMGVTPPNVAVTAIGPTSTSVMSSNGSYTITGLAPGTYSVTAAVPSTLEGTQSAIVTVSSGGAGATGNLSFTAVGTISSSVTLASATSSAGVIVAVAGTSSFQITPMSGMVTLTNVPAGTQTVVASYPGYGSMSASVQVAYNQQSKTGTLTLTAGGNTGTITGTVSLLGASANAIPVAAIGPTSAATLTNPSGVFSLSGLAPGNYEIVSSVPSTLEGTVTTIVTLTGATGNANTLSFTPLGMISGTATLGAQTTGNTGIVISLPGAGVSTVTSDNGSFLLRGVPTTATTLVASYPDYVTQSSAVSVAYDMTTPLSQKITLSPATSTGSITGTVTVSSVPTANVVVTLVGPVGEAAVTNSSGVYTFSSLPNGTYNVIATLQNTAQETQQAAVTLASQTMASPVNFAFTGLGTITGTATLAGAPSSAGIAVGVVGLPLVALTNASGNYTITGVPDGAQSVIASYSGYTSTTVSAGTVASGGSLTAPTITLTATTNPGSINGSVVLAPNGTGLAGAEVALSGPASGITFTGSTGAYTFTNLPNGSYTITVTALSTVEDILETSAAPSSTTESAPAATVTFHGLGALSGTVTLGSSTGNAGIEVAIPGTSLTTTTNNSGNYLLEKVPVGAQTVAAYYPGYVGTTTSATAVYNTTQSVPTMTLAASTFSGTVSGTVSLSNTTTPAGLAVTVSGPTTLVGQTVSGGTFSFAGVPPGSYMVTVNAPSTLQLVQAEPVTVTASSSPSPLTFSFTALGTVTGQVTLAGQAAAGNTGIIVSVSGTGLTAVTNSTGNFTIQNVPTGVQTLLATMPEYAAETVSVTVPYNSSTSLVGFATPLALSQYVPTTTIEGIATLLDQSSSAGITVAVQGTSLTTTTSSTGAYSLSNVPVGVINLTFSATGGYAETLPNVLASQNSTGTIDGPGPDGAGVQTYMLASTPMDVPMGTRLLSGATSLPVVSASGANVVELVPSVTGTATEVLSTSTAASSLVTDSGAYTPFFEAFGSNSQYLAYAAQISPTAYDVYAYHVSSGTVATIATNLPGSGPAFFQAGTSIAWYSCTSAGCNGYVSNTSGSNYGVLFTGNSSVPYFQLSPNGNYVFWLTSAGGENYLYYGVVAENGAGGAIIETTSSIGVSYVTSDSEYIVFSYGGEYNSFNTSTVDITPLTVSAPYSQTADDYFIFNGTCGATTSLCSLSLNGGASTPFSNYGSAALTAMSGAPLGRVCFVQPPELYCASAAGGMAEPMGTSDSSPTVVYTTTGLFVGWTNNGGFSVGSTGGGTITQVTAGGFRSAAAIDTTHLAVLFISPTTGSSVLDAVNLTVVPPIISTLATNVESFQVSPDGSRVAYIDPTDNWLYSIPSGGTATAGTATVITRYASSFEWAGTGHELLFVRHGTLPPYTFQDGVYSITAP